MMRYYIYATKKYETLEEVETSVTALKARLDKNPNDWCVVKPAKNSKTLFIDGKEIIAYEYGDLLSDNQINNYINSEKIYNVYSINDGDNFAEVSGSDVAEKVKLLRSFYAKWLDVTKYITVDESGELNFHDVTNEDMSAYVIDAN
jgi:hypothetical protein|tara:strand:+ start:2106 stop:2543 length:438 start_codon:yes stop_codon:yes gene_type:complete